MKPDCLDLNMICKSSHKRENMKMWFLSFVDNLMILIELLNIESRQNHEMTIYGGEICFHKIT
jgi:hypothetical protein